VSTVNLLCLFFLSIKLTILLLSIKVFDFGLSKEISEDLSLGDGTYKLTGETGSIRYMAPEVFLEKPYNMSCDAVSFEHVYCEYTSLSSDCSHEFSLVSIHLLSCCGRCLHWRNPSIPT
jgi:serine/threonine protein kinase